MAGGDSGEAWQATVSSRVLGFAAAVLAVAALADFVFWLVARPGVSFFVVLLALVFVAGFCGACARVRVVVGASGVAVESVVFGFSLARFALDEISDARVDDVRLGQWFGWGYRVTMGASALVLATGPGLVLSLMSGREFTVTLPSAAEALAALEAAAGRH